MKPVAAYVEPVAGENDLFNKNISKVSYSKGLRINAE
jgi:hypothetical protein